MEYNLTKHTLPRLSFALNTVSEQPVDIDLTLPDYCPDIGRILSCTLIPQLYIVSNSADRLSVEGGACVRIIYTDGDKGYVRSYEYTSPFSASLPISDISSDSAPYVELRPEYLNCRALSPRKLSLHGAFSLSAKLATADKAEYSSYDGDDDLQVKSESISASALTGLCSECFSVREEISTSSDMAAILSHRTTAKITELKAIHNKIMLSAELKLELLYLSGEDKSQVESMSYSLPVSRVIDCDGVEEDSVIDGTLTVMSGDVHMGDDALDGSGLMSLEAKLCFNALCYGEEKIEVMTDAFSTERDAELKSEPFSCSCGTVCRSYTDVGKASVTIDEGIGKIIDVHCERVSAACNGESQPQVSCKLCVGILYENTDGENRYAERDAEFVYKPDTEGCDTVEGLKAAVESLSYRLLDSRTLELRAELCYRLTLSSRKNCSAISSVTAADDAEKKQSDGSLLLYFTDENDSVWDISKRFSSKPSDIIAENDLDSDKTDEGIMLLIPTA